MFNQKQEIMKRLFSLPVIGLIATMLFAYGVSKAQTLFTVEVKGKGQPMLLIHGLFCNGEVWKETVEYYQDKYECHVLTLAGFGGNAPRLSENFLEQVKDEIIDYSKSRNLKRPVIMGHSMGGFISFWAAASAPDLFEKVIAVDGLPFMPDIQMPGATSESMKSMAEGMRSQMKNQTPEQIRQSQGAYLPTMITSKERIDQVTEIAVKADAATQAEVMYELFTVDLREKISAIKSPVLLLGAWIAYSQYGVTHDTALAGYTRQVKNVKDCEVALNDTAKHFIFYDDPKWFYGQVDSFLQKSL